MAAAQLASGGVRTTLIDEKPPWEKPCGGGITFKAYRQYPFLDGRTEARVVRQTSLTTAHAGVADVRLDRPILIFSRAELNRLLLDRALNAGAQFEITRAIEVVPHESGCRIRTARGMIEADHCIIATGARNPFRNAGTQWTAQDTMNALGYYIDADRPHIDIRFLEHVEGYIWVFPRLGHLSVGICGKGTSAQALRKILEDYMACNGLPFKGAKFYAHMLPALAGSSWSRNRIAGERWMAAGDAAGLVDPITGEGIYYAIRSGDLAAQALLGPASDRAAAFRLAVQRDFAHDLYLGSLLSRRVYMGKFLFGSIPDRMVQFTRRSPKFHSIVQDLFAGTQGYTDLSHRLWRNLLGMLRETAASFLDSSRVAANSKS
jgi:flavin-dependent dehydrogenase